MSFIRWLLLIALAFAFVLLAVSNWTMVDFVLPDGALVALPLPVLMAAAFVAGAVPTWAWMALLRPLSARNPRGRPTAERTEVAPPAAPTLTQPGS
jgi:uncharacterized integral membrane protein